MRGSLDRPRVRAYTLQRSLEDLETIRLQQTGELFQTPHPGGLPLWQEPPSTNFSSHSQLKRFQFASILFATLRSLHPSEQKQRDRRRRNFRCSSVATATGITSNLATCAKDRPRSFSHQELAAGAPTIRTWRPLLGLVSRGAAQPRGRVKN